MPAEGDHNASSAGVRAGAPSALDVISPNLSLVERRRRRRMFLHSMLITFVLTFGWIGGLIAIQVLSSTAYNISAETQQVLERIRDNQAALAYNEASPFLQETMVQARFEEYASDIRATLGEFREILAIKRVESISGPSGETARVKATLEFDRARTTAEFSYHYYEGAWRLLGFNIVIPPELTQEASSKDETKAARMDAPAEVYKLTQSVLAMVRDGQSEAVYDAAAEVFKASIDKETFLEIQKERDTVLGAYKRILDTMRSKRNKSRTMATLSMLVEYEKAKTTVTIDFRKKDDVWQLSYYKVEVPLPHIPVATPERPPE